MDGMEGDTLMVVDAVVTHAIDLDLNASLRPPKPDVQRKRTIASFATQNHLLSTKNNSSRLKESRSLC